MEIREFEELKHVKQLEQCLVHSKHSINALCLSTPLNLCLHYAHSVYNQIVRE